MQAEELQVCFPYIRIRGVTVRADYLSSARLLKINSIFLKIHIDGSFPDDKNGSWQQVVKGLVARANSKDTNAASTRSGACSNNRQDEK